MIPYSGAWIGKKSAQPSTIVIRASGARRALAPGPADRRRPFRPAAEPVDRRPDPADGRSVLLSLTEAGRAVQRQIGRQHARGVARAMTGGLDPAELRQLETICLKLAHRNEVALA